MGQIQWFVVKSIKFSAVAIAGIVTNTCSDRKRKTPMPRKRRPLPNGPSQLLFGGGSLGILPGESLAIFYLSFTGG